MNIRIEFRWVYGVDLHQLSTVRLNQDRRSEVVFAGDIYDSHWLLANALRPRIRDWRRSHAAELDIHSLGYSHILGYAEDGVEDSLTEPPNLARYRGSVVSLAHHLGYTDDVPECRTWYYVGMAES